MGNDIIHAHRRGKRRAYSRRPLPGCPSRRATLGTGPRRPWRTSPRPEHRVRLTGDLFIADTSDNVIREVNATTGTIQTVVGTGAAGYNGDTISATSAQLEHPWTVSVGVDNSLYIADLSNSRVRKVSGGVISTVAGTGSRSFGGDGGAATAANLNDPTSVILNPAAIYILPTRAKPRAQGLRKHRYHRDRNRQR